MTSASLLTLSISFITDKTLFDAYGTVFIYLSSSTLSFLSSASSSDASIAYLTGDDTSALNT